MSKIKKIVFYLIIILIPILIFIALIAFSSNNEYPSAFLQEELERLKSSLELRILMKLLKMKYIQKLIRLKKQ